MWCGAKIVGRVFRFARSISTRAALGAMVLLFSLYAAKDISRHLTADESALLRSIALHFRDSEPPKLSKLASFLSLKDQNRNGVVSFGSVTLTMDDDSFLGRIGSEKYWGKKRKKKWAGKSSAKAAKKLRAAKIDGAMRTGLLTTKSPKGSFFDFFSSRQPLILPPKPVELARTVGLVAGGYRTLCVRVSDGYYWPVSFATSRDQFLKDQRVCKRSCAEAVKLYVYRNPNGRPEDMVDLKGQPYNKLENAWRYREEYVAERKCSPHPWEEASLAKHQAYALMARRSGRYIQGAALRGQRQLVRVGRVRTMSTIDLDYIGNAKFSLKKEEMLQPGKIQKGAVARVVKERSAPSRRIKNRRTERRKRVGTKRMGLGVRTSIKKAIRRGNKRRHYRAKPKRRPGWAREALGLD